MTTDEQKGYDAYIKFLSETDGPSIYDCLDTCQELQLKVGSDERRMFVRGWLKARDER